MKPIFDALWQAGGMAGCQHYNEKGRWRCAHELLKIPEPNMSQMFNIYCDESCHLENDGQPVMVLGALSCPTGLRRASLSLRIREVKRKHKLSLMILKSKWVKVSPATG